MHTTQGIFGSLLQQLDLPKAPTPSCTRPSPCIEQNHLVVVDKPSSCPATSEGGTPRTTKACSSDWYTALPCYLRSYVYPTNMLNIAMKLGGKEGSSDIEESEMGSRLLHEDHDASCTVEIGHDTVRTRAGTGFAVVQMICGVAAFVSPLLLALVVVKTGLAYLVVLAYLALLTGTSILAYHVKDRSSQLRWLGGFTCVVMLSVYKTAVLMPVVIGVGSGTSSLVTRVLVYAIGALWECSNASLVFGGSTMLRKYGITSCKRALISGLAPCQVRFFDAQRVGMSSRRSLHLVVYLVGVACLREFLRCNEGVVNLIKAAPILEAEALAILVSAFVLVLDVPSLLWQFVMDGLFALDENEDCRVEVILPYGAVYLSTSTRDFWSKWSRPAMELIRQMVYHPLGGGRRPYLSIPLLFAINGASHYDVGYALVGDRVENSWNMVFVILGCAATLEVLATNYLSERFQQDLPLWFKFARGVATHVTFVYLFAPVLESRHIISFAGMLDKRSGITALGPVGSGRA